MVRKRKYPFGITRYRHRDMYMWPVRYKFNYKKKDEELVLEVFTSLEDNSIRHISEISGLHKPLISRIIDKRYAPKIT